MDICLLSYWSILSRIPRLRAGRSAVRFPIQTRDFLLLQNVWTGCGVNLTCYSLGTRCSFPRGKAAGAWSWSVTYIYCPGYEWCEVYLYHPPSPNSWMVCTRKTFTFMSRTACSLLLHWLAQLRITANNWYHNILICLCEGLRKNRTWIYFVRTRCWPCTIEFDSTTQY
jgi:hypothetical protein